MFFCQSDCQLLKISINFELFGEGLWMPEPLILIKSYQALNLISTQFWFSFFRPLSIGPGLEQTQWSEWKWNVDLYFYSLDWLGQIVKDQMQYISKEVSETLDHPDIKKCNLLQLSCIGINLLD